MEEPCSLCVYAAHMINKGTHSIFASIFTAIWIILQVNLSPFWEFSIKSLRDLVTAAME